MLTVCVRAFMGHEAWVHTVHLSDDGRRALSGGEDGAMLLWDVSAGRVVRRFTGHANAVVCVAFAADGRRVLSAASRYRTPDRSVRAWDAAGGAELAGRPASDDDRIEAAAFAPDGTRALLSRGDRGLELWTIPLSQPSGVNP